MLEIAASRLETARATVDRGTPVERALFDAVERLLARARKVAVRTNGVVVEKGAIHPDSMVWRLMEEAEGKV